MSATERSPSSRAAWITLLALLGAAVAACVTMAWPYLSPLFLGTVAAVIFHPINTRVLGVVRNKSLAATISTILLLILFLAPLTFLGMTVVREVRELLTANGQNTVGDGANRLWALLDKPLEAIASRVDMSAAELKNVIVTRAGQTAGFLVQRSVGAATSGFVALGVMLVTFFFGVRDGDRWRRKIIAWSPLKAKHAVALLNRLQEAIEASFYGIIAVAAAQGILLGTGAWMVGLPSPVLWGVIGTVASVIPIFGSSLVWIPASILLFFQGSVTKGLVMLGWGAGVVGMIDNLVRPLVVTSRLPLNAFLVFIAMLGGVSAFGVIGILAGPVALAMARELFIILRQEIKGSAN